jgi:hypothetical protein
MVTSAKEWKKDSTKGRVELPLPSGKTCLVKAPGMRALMTGGFIPNDLLDLVMSQLDTNAGKPPKSKPSQLDLMKSVKEDPSKIKAVFEMFDAIVVECVLAPEVHPVPEDEDDRDEELLYVDEVDEEDKQFIAGFVMGGTKDLKKFRVESAAGLDALQNESKPVKPTKRTTTRRG